MPKRILFLAILLVLTFGIVSPVRAEEPLEVEKVDIMRERELSMSTAASLSERE